MKGYMRIGLLLGILGAGAFVSAGAGVRAAEEKEADKAKAQDKKAQDKKIEKKVIKVRKFGPRIGVAGEPGSFLGVGIEDVDKDDVATLKLREERGALVTNVESDSAASAAGLKENDVILSFQGQPVWSAAQFRRLVEETPPGRTVSLEVSHDGAERSVSATLADRPNRAWMAALPALEELDIDVPELDTPEPPEAPEPPDALVAPHPRVEKDRVFRFRMPDPGTLMWRGGMFRERIPRKLGIEYQAVTGQLASYFKLEGDEGILVTSVTEDGPAAAAGVKAGDIILKVGGRPVTDGMDLRSALVSVEPGQEVALTVQRDGRPLELKLKAGGERSEKRSWPAVIT